LLRAGLRRPPPARSALTLRRSASMRLMTLAGSRSLGASIFSPARFFFSSSFSVFIMIFEFFRFEMPRFGLDDMRRELQHILRDLFVLDLVEILVLLADLVGVAQRDPEQAFAARLECDDVFARGENDSPERHHAFLADRLADDRERLLADLAVG